MNICENYYCSSQNHDGFCPMKCIVLCNPPCLYPFPSDKIPPPPPVSITSGSYNNQYLNTPQLILIVPLVLFAATLFFFSSLNIYRHFRNTQNQSSTTTWPYNHGETHLHHDPDHHRGGSEFSLEEEEEQSSPVLDHPIWYIRTAGLLPSVINGIAVLKFKKELDIQGKNCSVCLNEFEEDQLLRILPKCSHAFHIPCIDTWLTSHTMCPNCRALIVSPPAHCPNSDVPDGAESQERLL